MFGSGSGDDQHKLPWRELFLGIASAPQVNMDIDLDELCEQASQIQRTANSTHMAANNNIMTVKCGVGGLNCSMTVKPHPASSA